VNEFLVSFVLNAAAAAVVSKK